MEPKRRRAARILLLDGQDRILLFRASDPAVPEVTWWFTPAAAWNPARASAMRRCASSRRRPG
ncbi:hypothetical protein ACFQ0M_31470 [Kitasatospora aburaviensis]